MVQKRDKIFLLINYLKNISKTNWSLVTEVDKPQQNLAYIDTEKVKQLLTEIQNLEYQLVSSVSSKRSINIKKETTYDWRTANSNFYLRTEIKAIKISVLWFVSREIRYITCMLAKSYSHILLYTQNWSALGFGPLIKKWTFISHDCIRGFHNSLIIYMLQLGKSNMHKIFVAFVLFMQAILSQLNLKLDDRFLSCNITEVFV